MIFVNLFINRWYDSCKFQGKSLKNVCELCFSIRFSIYDQHEWLISLTSTSVTILCPYIWISQYDQNVKMYFIFMTVDVVSRLKFKKNYDQPKNFTIPRFISRYKLPSEIPNWLSSAVCKWLQLRVLLQIRLCPEVEVSLVSREIEYLRGQETRTVPVSDGRKRIEKSPSWWSYTA